jgi:DNA-binding response OmpR family regulator
MKVLLIEDDETTGKGVELMLRSLGHEHHWVTRGEAVAALALREAYDVILLDVMLPGIDGYEVLQQLRAAKVETPVILQSGLVERAEAAKGRSLGVADYLIKPYTKPELAAAIAAALERAAEAEAPPPEMPPEALPEPARERKRPPAPLHDLRGSMIKAGRILYDSGVFIMDCVVLNISDTGGALQPADAIRCPPNFTLKLEGRPAYRCEVCWRYRTKLGVRFLD